VLEHLVDVVLHFEGESGSRFRMVRAVKNRFGPVDEVGCFDLGPDGITAVTDPTGIFVERHHGRVAGTCVAVTMEGRRPLLAEVQSLVSVASQERPRRTTSGVDGSRLAMILAVLQQHGGIRLATLDVFASTVGGARLTEPAADLALAVAVASSHYLSPIPTGVVAMGEIGLSGELRRVRDVGLRIAEAARLGFELAVVPAEVGSAGRRRMVDGMQVVEVGHLRNALGLLSLTPSTGKGRHPEVREGLRGLEVIEGG
jgi:DNA repair protein RadA/Sms